MLAVSSSSIMATTTAFVGTPMRSTSSTPKAPTPTQLNILPEVLAGSLDMAALGELGPWGAASAAT